MSKNTNESVVKQALDWAYGKAISKSLPGIDCSFSLADFYLKLPGTLEEQMNSLIRWQVTKAASLGFLTGLGGLLTLPITIPVNLGGVVFVQIRMATSIAIMCGYDPHDDRVRTMVLVCLCGAAGFEILRNFGIELGTRLLTDVLTSLSKELIIKINKILVFKLAKDIARNPISKTIPFFGGVIGASFDSFSTNIIGEVAKKTFYINPIIAKH